MARKERKRVDLSGSGDLADSAKGLTHNPFAALRGKAGQDDAAGVRQGVGEARKESSPSAAQGSQGKVLPKGAHLVVRHERKGHGGKTVTVVDLSRVESLAAESPEALAKELRKALGAGARAGDQEVTVQGDLVERVGRHLEQKYGVRVTLGTR